MVQGRSKALILSIIAHFAIIVSLMYSTQNVHLVPPTIESAKPVKSYLYTPPKSKPVLQESKPVALESKQVLEQTKEVLEISQTQDEVKATENNQGASVSPQQNKQSDRDSLSRVDDAISLTEEPLASPHQQLTNGRVLTSAQGNQSISINPMKQLENMRKSIDAAIVESELAEHFQHRSLSNMHPNPTPVPKSVSPLTQDQVRAKNTQQLDSSLSITKTDNGACIITEDLSKVGIEGVTATSWARCGTTKMERMFSEHMKKVREKHFPASR